MGSPTDDSHWDLRIAWEKELSAGHWLGLTWPKEYGGRGASLIEEIIFEYEYARAAAPARVNQQALELLGPTLLEYGTHEQKSRFIPAIPSVDEVWGQGFSEPTAGSDLASVSTKGTTVRRTVGHRRPEGVDDVRRPRRLALRPVPH